MPGSASGGGSIVQQTYKPKKKKKTTPPEKVAPAKKSKQSYSPYVSAPKSKPAKVGVFKTPASSPKASGFRAQQTQQDHKVGKAYDKAGVSAAPSLKALPKPKTDRERRAFVAATQQGLKGLTTEQKANLLRSGDTTTRTVIRQAIHAQRELAYSQKVKYGAGLVHQNPGAYGVSEEDAARLHKFAKAGKLPSKVRDQLALLGARTAATIPTSIARAGHGKQKTIGIGPASINLTPVLAAADQTVWKGASGQAGKRFATGAGKLAVNATKDAAFLVPNLGIGLYQLGAAGVESTEAGVHAVTGRGPKGGTDRAKKLLKGFGQGAAGETVQAGYYLATGNSDKAYKHEQAAMKQIMDHPLNTYLEVAGASQALSRAGGIPARAGLFGKNLKKAGTTMREVKPLGDMGNQSYNQLPPRGLAGMTARVVREKRAAKKGLDPDVLHDAQSVKLPRALTPSLRKSIGQRAVKARNQGSVRAALSRGASLPTGALQGARTAALLKLADEFAGQERGLQVRGKGEVADAMKDLSPEKRSAKAGPVKVKQHDTALGNIVMHAVEGKLRSPESLADDLRKERDRLQGERRRNERLGRKHDDKWTNESSDLNKLQIDSLTKVLESPKLLERAKTELFRSRDEYGNIGDALEKQLIEHHGLDAKQALISKIRPYLTTHHGARWWSVGQHVKVERAARAVEREAARAVKKAEKGTPEHAAAVKALHDARENRILTSGRNPDQVRTHEAIRARVIAAQREHRAAQSDLDKAVKARQRLIGSQASRRGRRQGAARKHDLKKTKGPRPEGKATAAELRKLEAANARVEAASAAEKAAGKARKAAAAELKGKKLPKIEEGLRKPNGEAMTAAEGVRLIKEDPHMGPVGTARLPHFVSHRQDIKGSSAYYRNWFGARPTVDSKGKRTGAASVHGSHSSDFESLKEDLVYRKGVVNAIQAFDRFAHRFGSTKKNGDMYAPGRDLDRAISDFRRAGVDVVPVRTGPSRYAAERLKAIAEDQKVQPGSPEDLAGHTLQRMEDAKLIDPADTTANIVLVPKIQFDRFAAHQFGKSNVAGKFGQVYTAAFRGTVLPFSVKWLAGNNVEGVLRSVIDGVHPRDPFLAQKVVKALTEHDIESLKIVDETARSGLLYNAGRRLNTHRTAESFEGSILERPANVTAALTHAPGVKYIGKSIHTLQDGAFGMNGALERLYDDGVIGKTARLHARAMGHSWWKATRLQEDALRDVVHGLTETKNQIMYARAVKDALGKYGDFSPALRRIIQNVAPFLPWYLNSIKFITYTLPIKHPLKTAILAQATETMRQDIEEGQKYLADNNIKDGSLRHDVRDKSGKFVPFTRYTPFGAFASLPEGFTDPIGPQVMSIIKIVNGKAWTDQDLKGPNGKPSALGRLALALNAAAESTIPGLSIARRLQEQGQSSFDTSWIGHPQSKPGTARRGKGILGAARRIEDPTYPVSIGDGGGSSFSKGKSKTDWSKFGGGGKSFSGSKSKADWSKFK